MNNKYNIQPIIQLGDSVQLSEKVEKYPFASIYRLAALAKSPNDSSLIAAAAFRISDRRFLYSLIQFASNQTEKILVSAEVAEKRAQKVIEKYEGEIEKFILEEPRIQIDRNFSPIIDDLAEKSIKNNEEIISETLAEILYSQGKKGKALDFYEKLSLKFPEKSSYFAVRIEKIKQEL